MESSTSRQWCLWLGISDWQSFSAKPGKPCVLGWLLKMTGPLLWRHLNSVSTKSLFLLALAYTRFLLQHPLEVSAQHSPPLPVSIPTVMKLNSNHSLPNGGVARVEDHITLTTKRKPWRGPAKMSVSRLEGYKNQIAPVLPSRLKLMSKGERSKFNKELREQQDLLHDIASGKEIDPRP